MQRKGLLLGVFLLGILAGSLILIPAIGDTTWIMGELKPVADRLHVGERFEGYHVADILDAMTDRLMACCPNVPPTAVDDEFRTILGATEYIEVLANDEDLDLDALSIMGVGTPPHGQASHTWNMVRYVAPSDWCGWDPVTYEVSDGQGHTVEATLLVMIECGPVISEIELNPAGPDDGAEWIELHNASNERVSLAGWQLSITANCASGEKTCWQDLPSDATLAPWEHRVFTLQGEGFHDTNGWQVALRDPSGILVDQTAAGLQDTLNNYMTWQRSPDGSRRDSDWVWRDQTPGTYND